MVQFGKNELTALVGRGKKVYRLYPEERLTVRKRGGISDLKTGVRQGDPTNQSVGP